MVYEVCDTHVFHPECRQNPTLTELNLSHMSWDLGALYVLCDAIGTSKTFTELRLDGIPVCYRGIKVCISPRMANQPTSHTLHLR